MWMLDPKVLCSKHLLGEHVELHMLLGFLKKGKNLGKFLKKKQVDPSKLKERHEALVEEMGSRYYKHYSPLEIPDDIDLVSSPVDLKANAQDLTNRCEECKERFRMFT